MYGLNENQVRMVANPKLTVEQMERVIAGFSSGVGINKMRYIVKLFIKYQPILPIIIMSKVIQNRPTNEIIAEFKRQRRSWR